MLKFLADLSGETKGYFTDGGYVMPVLVVAGFLLWMFIGMRFFLLRKGFVGSLADNLCAKTGRRRKPGIFDLVITQYQSEKKLSPEDRAYLLAHAVLKTQAILSSYRRGIQVLCKVAPLLGLLGTVSGMIETFSSLVDMEMFSKSGGVGGGISEALISTQMGLMIAVPGVIAGKLLDKKEETLKMEMYALPLESALEPRKAQCS
jgi:biopolymer transport protein ExbB